MEAMARKIEAASATDRNFVAALELILRISFENFAQTFSYFSTVTSHQALNAMQAEISKHHELTDRFHEMLRRGLGVMEKVLNRAREKGEITDIHDSKDLSWVILSLVQGVHMSAWMNRKKFDVDSSVKQIIDFIMNGISAKNKHTGRA
jgi:AcrR family transcriptional regulator